MVLSYVQAEALLAARRGRQGTTRVSADLGLAEIEAILTSEGVRIGGARQVSWKEVEEIAGSKNTCFAVRDGGLEAIQRFSSVTDRFCSLMATQGAPTLLVAGFSMHRIKDTDPHRDTLSKLRAIAPVVGAALDTATGLGYTAIEASRTADHVVTVELDPAVLEIARMNPWSRELFDNPRITQLLGDSRELVAQMGEASYSRILHDPPTFSLAGELYSGAWYRELFRVLIPGGRMFHYLGDPSSRLGKRVTGGAIRRLQEAGFVRVRAHPEAFGVVADKPRAGR